MYLLQWRDGQICWKNCTWNIVNRKEISTVVNNITGLAIMTKCKKVEYIFPLFTTLSELKMKAEEDLDFMPFDLYEFW